MDWSHAKGQITQKRKIRLPEWKEGTYVHLDEGHLNQCEPEGILYNWRISEAEKASDKWEVYRA